MVWKKQQHEIKLKDGFLQLFTTERGFLVFVSSSTTYKNKPSAETQLHKNVFDLPFVLIEPTRAYINNTWVEFVSPVQMQLAVPVLSVGEMKAIVMVDLERAIEQGYAEQLTRARLASEDRERHLKALRRNYIHCSEKATMADPGPRATGYGLLQELQQARILLDLRQTEDAVIGDLLARYTDLNK